MKDFTSIRREIETYISTSFTEVPVIFENCEIVEQQKEFILLEDQMSAATSAGISMAEARITGSLVFTIFTELNTGSNRSRELASILSNSIEAYTETDIEFDEPYLISVAFSPTATYFAQILKVPYTTSVGDDID